MRRSPFISKSLSWVGVEARRGGILRTRMEDVDVGRGRLAYGEGIGEVWSRGDA